MWISILIITLAILIYARMRSATVPSARSIREGLEFLEIGLTQVEKLAEDPEASEAKESVEPLLERARTILEDLKKKDIASASPNTLRYMSNLLESAANEVSRARRILEPYFEDEDDWQD